MAVVAVQRFEVWLINLDPTQGSEINKTRPCVVLSPDEMNRYLRTVTIAAPIVGTTMNIITTTRAPTRVMIPPVP